jgi:hypothetical protein
MENLENVWFATIYIWFEYFILHLEIDSAGRLRTKL